MTDRLTSSVSDLTQGWSSNTRRRSSLHSRATHGRSQASTTSFRDPRRPDRSVLDRCRIDRHRALTCRVFSGCQDRHRLAGCASRNRRAQGQAIAMSVGTRRCRLRRSRGSVSRRGTSPVSRRPRCPRAGGMGQVRQVVPVRGLGGGRRPRRVRQAVSRCRRPGGRPRRRRTEQGTLGVGRCR